MSDEQSIVTEISEREFIEALKNNPAIKPIGNELLDTLTGVIHKYFYGVEKWTTLFYVAYVVQYQSDTVTRKNTITRWKVGQGTNTL